MMDGVKSSYIAIIALHIVPVKRVRGDRGRAQATNDSLSHSAEGLGHERCASTFLPSRGSLHFSLDIVAQASQVVACICSHLHTVTQ